MFWVLIYIATNFLAPISLISLRIDDFLSKFRPKRRTSRAEFLEKVQARKSRPSDRLKPAVSSPGQRHRSASLLPLCLARPRSISNRTPAALLASPWSRRAQLSRQSVQATAPPPGQPQAPASDRHSSQLAPRPTPPPPAQLTPPPNGRKPPTTARPRLPQRPACANPRLAHTPATD
jgi:hypothetical protein